MVWALVTGATSGIGAAYARALAGRGFDLVLVARDEERLEREATRYRAGGRRVEVLAADLAVRADVDRVAARLDDRRAPIEVLVNDAGFSVEASLVGDGVAGEALDRHDRALEVMLRAVLVLAGRAAGAMRARGHGTILNVGSIASLAPTGAYSAIKAWVTTFTMALAVELHGTGVRAMVVRPGWVHTEFHSRAGVSTARIPSCLWIDAERLVAGSFRDLARGRTGSTPTLRFRVVAAVLQHTPPGLVLRIARSVAAARRG